MHAWDGWKRGSRGNATLDHGRALTRGPRSCIALLLASGPGVGPACQLRSVQREQPLLSPLEEEDGDIGWIRSGRSSGRVLTLSRGVRVQTIANGRPRKRAGFAEQHRPRSSATYTVHLKLCHVSSSSMYYCMLLALATCPTAHSIHLPQLHLSGWIPRSCCAVHHAFARVGRQGSRPVSQRIRRCRSDTSVRIPQYCRILKCEIGCHRELFGAFAFNAPAIR